VCCADAIEDQHSDRRWWTIAEEPPFSVGMDFFGLFVVKQGRSTVKRYGVLFTCLGIRAVNLEV